MRAPGAYISRRGKRTYVAALRRVTTIRRGAWPGRAEWWWTKARSARPSAADGSVRRAARPSTSPTTIGHTLSRPFLLPASGHAGLAVRTSRWRIPGAPHPRRPGQAPAADLATRHRQGQGLRQVSCRPGHARAERVLGLQPAVRTGHPQANHEPELHDVAPRCSEVRSGHCFPMATLGSSAGPVPPSPPCRVSRVEAFLDVGWKAGQELSDLATHQWLEQPHGPVRPKHHA
jgi:hypothetical protein